MSDQIPNVDDEEFEDHTGGLDSCDACPECGEYYVLMVTAPSMPDYVASASDAEMDAWEEEHNYNIVVCTRCHWSSENE